MARTTADDPQQQSPSNSPTQPDLQGHRVLDLGCGYGEFARWARDNGAAYVNAVDIAHNDQSSEGARRRRAP